jgi:hypothetical protein
MNVKRPKRITEEDEDDLMEIQQEFLKQKIKPSVKLVKKNSDGDVAKTSKPPVEDKQSICFDNTTIQGVLFDIVVG